MDGITVTLGGIDYTGRALTLRSLRRLRKSPSEMFDLDVLAAWLGDRETAPKVADPDDISASPTEVSAAAVAILKGSGYEMGEAPAETGAAASTSPGSMAA